jgi:hypothetical protein
MASIVGRYYVRIGPHTPVRRALTTVPSQGRAVLVTDTHPETPDEARTFYLVDPQGRRAGWIDGTIVEEIPDSYAGKEPASWSDPAAGDPDFDTAPEDPPPPPRAIVVPNPQAGTSLRVLDNAGENFALSVDSWVDGAVVAHDDLTGTGSGQETTLSSPALEAVLPAATTTSPGSTTTGTTLPPAPTGTQAVVPKLAGLTVTPRPVRRSARVRFRLNVAASVRFTVERRKGDGFVRLRGSVTRAGKAGANSLRLKTRIGGRVLRAARYRLVAVPTAAGRTGPAARATFRVERRGG